MILVIDNYDSFTWNLVHYLQELGAEVEVVRNDAIGVGQAMSSGAQAFLISPGPCTPNEAGISLELVEACADQARPLLGVCLGHQAIGQHFGGRVVRAPKLMHGKTSPVHHDGSGVFAGLPSPFTATRYHSLVVEGAPDTLVVNARTEDDVVMGFRHATLPLHGVQFHPESIATEHGHDLLANFMASAGIVVKSSPARGGGPAGSHESNTFVGAPQPVERARNAHQARPPLHHASRGPPPRAGEDRMTTLALLPDPISPLEHETAEQAFADIFDGKVADEAIAQFLTSLSERGETSIEIAAAAKAMRARLIPIDAPPHAIDVCGTGGDGHHTLNVSTAVALVVAACGVPVAKHGNRAASSKAGAADTLEALGLDMTRVGQTAEATLAELGICFLFAANHHPAMRRIQPIRVSIGRRTIFNLMGPLANPARVTRQLIGIARTDYVSTYAEALALLGTERAMIVSGNEGLDEVSIAGPTQVGDVAGMNIDYRTLTPDDAGLPRHPIAAIRGGDAADNAAALRRLLQGEQAAYRDAVLLNSAAALLVAGEVDSLVEGVEEAAEAIDRGLANTLLDCWIAF